MPKDKSFPRPGATLQQEMLQAEGECLRAYWRIFRQAMLAWHVSKKDDEPVETAEDADDSEAANRQVGNLPHAKSKPKKARKARNEGNAAFLGKAMDAVEAIRELLGLDMPRRTEVPVSAAETKLTPDDISNMSTKDLRDFIARLKAEAAEPQAAENAPPQLVLDVPFEPVEEGDGPDPTRLLRVGE
jgi:hypothetical protein